MQVKVAALDFPSSQGFVAEVIITVMFERLEHNFPDKLIVALSGFAYGVHRKHVEVLVFSDCQMLRMMGMVLLDDGNG